MNNLKIHILEKALKIIDNDIDEDLYEWLLQYTAARPKRTALFLSEFIDGLKASGRENTGR